MNFDTYASVFNNGYSDLQRCYGYVPRHRSLSTRKSTTPSLRLVTARFPLWTLGILPLIFSSLHATSCRSPSSDPDDAVETSGGGMGGDAGEVPLPESELCTLGESNTDQNKCQGEPNTPAQSCSPFLNSTDDACDEDEDCPGDALCFQSERFDQTAGECFTLIAACVEQCSGDFDCPSSTYCNRKTGDCGREPSSGLNFGEPCSPERDECAGNCVQVDDDKYECEEHCRVGSTSGCGAEDMSKSGLACAFFAYDLGSFDQQQGSGDTGVCSRLCQCNDECPGDQLCYAAPQSGFNGVCAAAIAESESVPQCEQDGAGGNRP